MNIFQLSISTIVFASTLLLGTIASRPVISTFSSFTEALAIPEVIKTSSAEPGREPVFEDLRRGRPANASDFDPTGNYSLGVKELPNPFDDISFLHIMAREYSLQNGSYVASPTVPTGSLHGKRSSFSLTRISIGNREISFETDTVDGLKYRFLGHFPRSAEHTKCECEGCEHRAELKGSLKKVRGGKVIAEMDATFYLTWTN